MTNPVTPAPAPSGGGMPKWLIILIVVLVVVVIGCCGGIGTCVYVVRRGAQAAKEHAAGWQAQLQQKMEEAQHQAQAAAEQAAKEHTASAGSPTTPTPQEDVESTPLPGNFPSDVPIYSGMTPTFATSDNVNGSGVVTMIGAGTVPQVTEYYRKQLPAKGWTLETDQSIAGQNIMTYSKGEQHLSMILASEEGKVRVTMNYAKK